MLNPISSICSTIKIPKSSGYFLRIHRNPYILHTQTGGSHRDGPIHSISWLKFARGAIAFGLNSKCFHTQNVPENIVKNLEKKGILKASKAQKIILPLLYSNQNIILKDATGTGKTLALVIGSLSKKNPKLADLNDISKLEKEMQEFLKRRLGKKMYLETLFIVPTRELALQIYHWLVEFGDCTNGQIQCMIAGEATIEQQKEQLTKVPKIIVGTPKRLLELHKAKAFDTFRLQTLIIDEVDQMVDALSRYATITKKYNRLVHRPPLEELVDQIVQIRKINTKRKGIGAQEDAARKKPLQVIVSSATLNNPIRHFLKNKKWLGQDHVKVDLNTALPQGIKHCAYYLDEHQVLSSIDPGQFKFADLKQVLPLSDSEASPIVVAESVAAICHMKKIKKLLVFIQSNNSLQPYVDELSSLGLSAELLTSMQAYNPAQSDSKKPFQEFLDGNTQIVIARDFESRGLDIPSLDFVLLVGDFSPQSYIHTTGRTGRFGKNGTAITLLLNSKQKARFLQMIKRLEVPLSL